MKSRGSGGLHDETNLITLCVFCHTAVHEEYILPGKRIAESKAKGMRLPVFEGKRMRDYLRGILEAKYGYSTSSVKPAGCFIGAFFVAKHPLYSSHNPFG